MAALQLGNVANNLIALQLLTMLCTPFSEFPAYKTGVIDDKGNYLVRPEYRTLEQRKSIGYLDRLIINVKKLINKLPGGENKIKNIVAGMFLIRESVGRYRVGDSVLLEEDEHLLDSFGEDLWALKDTRDRYHASREQTLELWSEYCRIKEEAGAGGGAGGVGVGAMSGSMGGGGEPCGGTPTNTTGGVAGYSLPLGSVVRRKKKEREDREEQEERL